MRTEGYTEGRLTPTSSTSILSRPTGPRELLTMLAMETAAITENTAWSKFQHLIDQQRSPFWLRILSPVVLSPRTASCVAVDIPLFPHVEAHVSAARDYFTWVFIWGRGKQLCEHKVFQLLSPSYPGLKGVSLFPFVCWDWRVRYSSGHMHGVLIEPFL